VRLPTAQAVTAMHHNGAERVQRKRRAARSSGLARRFWRRSGGFTLNTTAIQWRAKRFTACRAYRRGTRLAESLAA
jgi:hypothetical protein